MEFSQIQFPIEGSVQEFVHFLDPNNAYTFSFATPFCYNGAEDFKRKGAYLFASFDTFRMISEPKDVYAYYTLGSDVKDCPIKKAKAGIKTASLFDGDGTFLGKTDLLTQKGFFRGYNGLYPNRVFDAEGKLAAFTLWLKDKKQKCLYTFEDGFEPYLDAEITTEQALKWEEEKRIQCVLSYDLVNLEASAKTVFEMLFSPSKKSEYTHHRVRRFVLPSDESQQRFWLLALFSCVWTTFLEAPLS